MTWSLLRFRGFHLVGSCCSTVQNFFPRSLKRDIIDTSPTSACCRTVIYPISNRNIFFPKSLLKKYLGLEILYKVSFLHDIPIIRFWGRLQLNVKLFFHSSLYDFWITSICSKNANRHQKITCQSTGCFTSRGRNWTPVSNLLPVLLGWYLVLGPKTHGNNYWTSSSDDERGVTLA